MNRWLGRLWFAPTDLKQYARADRAMQGIYVPYWTYDAETAEPLHRPARHGLLREPPDAGDRQRPAADRDAAGRPRALAARRAARWRARFDDVLVLGSTSLPKRFTDALAPWDLSALSAYDPRFLAGFRAEGYTVPVETAYGEARAMMNAVIEDDVRRDIGGDQQRIERIETDVGRLTFKHVLLPVWLAAYRYRGKSFRFVVNGRTGTVEGERPWSAGKIAALIALALLVALAIACLQIAGEF